MRTRIYLREWFFNAGIVGFIRILEHNKNNFVQIGENYIEFDTRNLIHFHHNYFQYFFDLYNLGNKTKERIEKSFGKIENLIRQETKDKVEEKNKKETIKSEKKYIKAIIKSQMDKIKKFDEETYQTILEKYSELDEINQIGQIEQLQQIENTIIQAVLEEKVNQRLTMNLFKSILSKNYFGQPSFLNVVKSALSFEEQKEVMYQDYISNIIESDFLQEMVKETYNIEEIQKRIQEKLKNPSIHKEILKIYENIRKKYLEKGKTEEDIKNYIEQKVFSDCCLCENTTSLTSNYSESNFVPLAVSSDNMKNFFWNQKVEFPICDVCKLILFCIPAGITSITKTVKENTIHGILYKEKEVYSFVNYDTNVDTLMKTNLNFGNCSKQDRSNHNPYPELILDIIGQNKKISEWQLQNILIVEFETEYLAYSRMEYFNIKRYVARFFKHYADSTLNGIKDYRFRLEIVDYILKNKDIANIVNERLREEIRKDNRSGWNCYLANKIKVGLAILKKEGKGNMEEEIKNANRKLHVMFLLGNEIYMKLKKEKNENKLDSYIYKMLNCIKGNRKDEFMDTAIRVIWSAGKDVPEILVIHNEELNWKELGHSFISGLTQVKYEKNKEVKENE